MLKQTIESVEHLEDMDHNQPELLESELIRQINAEVPEFTVTKTTDQKKYSRAYEFTSVRLNTNAAQWLFERTYSRTDLALCLLSVSVGDMGANDLAEKAEAEFETRADELIAELRNAIDKMDSICESKKIPQDDRMPAYECCREYNAPYRSPYSLRYVLCIQFYDQLISYVEKLWLKGFVSSEQRREIVKSWKEQIQQLAAFCGTTRVNYMRQTFERLNAAKGPAKNKKKKSK